jgi:hypothetical protein
MSIITRPRPRVKSTRHAQRKPAPFGEGIFDRRAPFTAEDLAYWAENAPGNQRGYFVVGALDPTEVECWTMDAWDFHAPDDREPSDDHTDFLAVDAKEVALW